ncbi:MAG TPA: alpha-1,4-glucan--maltose-1-phosphate maltosyltransferase [Chlorobaculum parvum]|uniref:Alpha-1,4-glucan:maltose-1-phosphate maltosyltransferase n=1 Tax=Chlorobaculum parvum TaxID=274539 RepID=A0A7C5DFA5_9CHLB|nr:alpha-1,4-glucan--maltose-1-phosphate maltosyltransferase [Chlorobaculum parvum]
MKSEFALPALVRQDHPFDGRRRVVIDRVFPEIDGGRFPAKKVENDRMTVEADIFTDGADTIVAELLYRRKSETEWRRTPMTFVANDRWTASFGVGEPGVVEYTVEAWVDHFQTWRKGFQKKLDAGQEMSLELRIGATIVELGAARATGDDAGTLHHYVGLLSVGNGDAAVEAALSEGLAAAMERSPERSMASRYEKTLLLQIDQKQAGFSTWYELFPRSWAGEPGKHGTFRDCMNLLPRIALMGFDVLYLPPIHPIGVTKRKGKNNALVAGPDDPGSCWAIGSEDGGHTSVHPELGTMDEFVALVQEAEAQGISVALDIAFQCSPDHPWVKEHPQWFRWRPDGTVQFAENPPKKYEDILPIDFESEDWQNLWIALRDVFIFWIDKGVKIFRVDNPHTKGFAFWEWALGSILEKHPDTVFLAEAFTRPKLMARLAKGGYSQSYTYFTWRNTKHDLQEYLTELTQTELKDYMRPNFWPNTPDILHEELQGGSRPRFIIRMVLAATLSSNYGMYGPAYELLEHVPFPGKEEYVDSEKYEIKQWDLDRPGNIRSEIATVNRIRKENPALQQTNDITFVKIDATEGREHDQLMGYVKCSPDGSNVILTVVTLDDRNTRGGWLRFPLEKFGCTHTERFTVEDLITGRTFDWNGEWNYIELNPHIMPAHIFRVNLPS